MGKKYDKKVRWEFKIAVHGYGRTCKEALEDAANRLHLQTTMEFHQSDFDSIEEHETVDVIEDDFESD